MEPEFLSALPEEARSFQGDRAGIVTRAIANTVDITVVALFALLGYGGWLTIRFLANPPGFTVTTPSFLAALIVVGVLLFFYFTFSWATTGRTYGDHVMGLRVVNFRGDRVHWAGAIVRSALCTLFPIALLWVIVSSENRSVQDVILRTSCIHDWGTKSVRV